MPLPREKQSSARYHYQEFDSASSSSNTCCSHCAAAITTPYHDFKSPTPSVRHGGPDMERIERLARPTERVLRELYEDAKTKAAMCYERDKWKDKWINASHFGSKDTEKYFHQPRCNVDVYGFNDQMREDTRKVDFFEDDQVRVPAKRATILKSTSRPYPDYEYCMMNYDYADPNLSYTESDSSASADVLRSSLSECAADLTHQLFDRDGYNTDVTTDSETSWKETDKLKMFMVHVYIGPPRTCEHTDSRDLNALPQITLPQYTARTAPQKNTYSRSLEWLFKPRGLTNVDRFC